MATVTVADQLEDGWPEPTDAQVHRLQGLTAHPARMRYFFTRLENPLWLGRLASEGWFDPERVPEPVTEADGTVRIEIWPPSEYLRRVAGAAPRAAAAVIRRLTGTENPIVQRDLVAALRCLPPASAAGFTSGVITWIRGPHTRWLDERDISALAARLLDGGEQEAGRRLAAAVLAWLEDGYWLREGITELAGPLQRSGADGVLVVADALGHAIGDETSALMANFGRASIADHEQDQHVSAADHLIDGLRDCLLAYLERTGDPDVLAVLLRRNAALYARIVYYATAVALSGPGDPGGGPASDSRLAALSTYARTLVMNNAAFADSSTRLEYGLLARTVLAHLQPRDITQLADWIRQGPQMSDAEISQMHNSPGAPAAAEYVAGFKDHWRADRIALLGPDLPDPLRDIDADLKARGVRPPEHPGFSHWISVDQAIESPVSARELASMSVADVIELAGAYKPPNHIVFRFPEHALAQQITEDITARPVEYSRDALGFSDLRPAYVSALLNGLREAIAAQRTRNRRPYEDAMPPLGLVWEPVLALAASIASKQDPGGRNAEQHEDSPRWLHRSAAMLLKTALDVPGSGLPGQDADTILSILRALLGSPDPMPEDEAGDDALNPADRALNSVRGQATGCLVAFARWWRRLGANEGDVPPALLELLSGELDPTHEPSASVRTVYGQFFPHLRGCLPGWAGEHLEAMFGSTAANLGGSNRAATEPPALTPADQLGQASFDAYLLVNGPQDSSFLDLLRPYYEREVSRLRLPPRAWRSALRNTRQVVLDHLLLFMLWGALTSDDPLMKLAIRRAGPQQAGEAVGHLGWLIFRSDDTQPGIAHNAQDLWDWWRDRAQTRSGNGDRDAAAMVEGFPWWWRASSLDTSWQFRELLRVLEIAPAMQSPGLVTQTISDRVEGNESSAVAALDIILTNTTNDMLLQDAAIKAQPALRHLLSALDPDVRRRATILVQKIASWGMVEFAMEITPANQ